MTEGARPGLARPLVAALACAWAALALFTYVVLPARLAPAEDAAILYLYSENLARTGVISYFAGGPPVEGATDFGWMVLLSGLHRLGLDTYRAAGLLSLAAHLATALLVQRIAARGGARDARVFFAAAFGLFLVPALFAAVQGFSVLFFGFTVLLAGHCFLAGRARALALASLAACLVRPDGVVYALPLLAALPFAGREHRSSVLRTELLWFALPGLAYFAWRRWLFGEWLPLPFYVKADVARTFGPFHGASLGVSAMNLAFLAPLLALFVWRLRALAPGERARPVALAAALVLVPSLFYSCMLLAQNVGGRFQYPIVLAGSVLPLALGSARPRAALHAGALALSLLAQSAGWAAMALATALVPLETTPALARDLAPIQGARMAVSEAGRLPYYSRWECIDLWGLNTPEFARRLVRPDDVVRLAPDLVVLHGSAGQYRELLAAGPEGPEASERSWASLVQNAYLGAARAGYELLLVPFEHEAEGEGWLERAGAFARRVQAERGEALRHDLYLLAPASEHKAEIERVLRAHGAVDVQGYAERLKRHGR